MMESLSRHLFYPLWDIKDRSQRLREWQALEKQQWWPTDRLRMLQWERLQKLLAYAAEHSPFYRDLFHAHGISPATFQNHDDLLRIPVTTKSDIRNNLDRFISDEFDRAQLVSAKTGGSTGVSLQLFFDEACQERRNAAQLLADRWSGWDLGMKKAAVWGNPPVAETLKQKLRHHLLDRTIYLDTMNLNNTTMGDFVQRWREEQPGAVFGHAHSIFIFACYLRDQGITDLRPKGIVATSMMLLDHERKVIEQVFDCAVTNRYGCEEVGLIACECERHDGMHLNIPHVYVEFLDGDNKPVKPGEPGKIVVTDLNNFAMPLIRYRVEDVGVYRERACSCGRGLPILERLEGRVADFLKLPDGGQVAGISLVERTLTKVPGIEQMQLIQESEQEVVINRVRGRDYNEQTDFELRGAMTGVFGEKTKVTIRDVTRIEQDPSGKYRFSICRI
ncbi:phenylacetate--CoA ligase family protein [Marinobacter profundi]|uniref:Adenylyltransferase n=1 Tax=Marinobacter profundi TaxID=2666256 RepID=A0A2G1UNX8_9GAMM|nr:phenylacetate--CoA ligase family protein [Marinobacter profundi]PHQ16216.1 adenylyltransferase [Marinobacter profundi]